MANSKYGRILAIATTVFAILLGILFIICCAHLYFTGGEQPYSRERVGEYLVLLAVPSFITIALAAWGIVYNVVTSQSDEENASRTNSELLESFEKRYDFESFDEDTKRLVSAERNMRKITNIVICSNSALFFALAFIYVAFFAKFTVENLNADVMAAFAVALPLSAFGVALHVPRIYVAEGSCKKEIELLKASIKNHGAPAPAKKADAKSVDYADIARYVIVGVAVALVVLGIANGGVGDVLQKAVKICTECIGLG